MKNLFLIIVLLTSPAWATFALVQHPCNASCAAGTTPCTVTTSATGANNLIVVTVFLDYASASPTISSVSGGGTYTHCANCGISNTTVGRPDASYTLASTSGATSITVTLSATTGANPWHACVREYSATSPVLNTGATPSGNRNQSTNSLTPADVTLTMSVNNGLNIQFGTFAGTASALSGFANCDFPSGNGICDKLNTTSGTSANWTQAPTNQASLGGISFEESAGVTKKCTLTLLGAGPC